MISPVSGIAPTPPPRGSSTLAIQDAASKFEALLLGQLLKSARETGESAGHTADSLFEMAEGQLAEVLASRGGLGLAKLIATQLQPKTSP